mgnify:CR=1 FL=1
MTSAHDIASLCNTPDITPFRLNNVLPIHISAARCAGHLANEGKPQVLLYARRVAIKK